jgi:hypothetical protein
MDDDCDSHLDSLAGGQLLLLRGGTNLKLSSSETRTFRAFIGGFCKGTAETHVVCVGVGSLMLEDMCT